MNQKVIMKEAVDYRVNVTFKLRRKGELMFFMLK